MQRIKPAWDNYGKRPEIEHRTRLFKGFIKIYLFFRH
jgi:hypothetical protein